jgi:hypothetical protein
MGEKTHGGGFPSRLDAQVRRRCLERGVDGYARDPCRVRNARKTGFVRVQRHGPGAGDDRGAPAVASPFATYPHHFVGPPGFSSTRGYERRDAAPALE